MSQLALRLQGSPAFFAYDVAFRNTLTALRRHISEPPQITCLFQSEKSSSINSSSINCGIAISIFDDDDFDFGSTIEISILF